MGRGINCCKVATLCLEACAIALLAPIVAEGPYENSYLFFLGLAFLITFLYLMLVNVCGVIQETANVVIFDKVYHIIMFILLVLGWGQGVYALVDYYNASSRNQGDYNKQMALRISSLIFSGFNLFVFIHIIHLFFQ